MFAIHRFICSLGILALVCIAGIPGAAATEHAVAPSGAEFTSIQSAIDWAYPGDTITVHSGTYVEEILLDKKISLIGIDNGGGIPVIDTEGKGNAIEVRVDECRVEGFAIRNSTSFNGIRISSSNNTIRQNIFSDNAKGILLLSAMKNTIYGNTITGSSQAGITLEASNENLIEENILAKNAIGIALDSFSLSNRIYWNNFDNSQNVNSKSATSVWSSPFPFIYTHLGLKEQNYMGNYWGDYSGKDANGDGIGDSPYGIMIGANPKAIIESNQNIIDAFPLMDPKQYYHDLVPITGEINTPGLMPMPTVREISRTEVPTATSSELNLTSPSPTPVSPGKTPEGQPTGILMFELIVLLVAGVVVLIIFGLLKRNETIQRDRSQEIEASVGDKNSNSPNTRFTPVVIAPGEDTKGSVLSKPYTSVGEQNTYFPKELESKYSEIKYIGRGGIAWVFSARRKTDDIQVAVKIPISFDEITGKSFLNEIAAWETLRHPNIVEVTAVNILPVPFVEMEYVPKSLETIEKPVPIWKAVHIVSGIADGLWYAHKHGFIHRDIKPHNILLDENFVPKITDWGMSKILTTELRKSSIAGFSLAYAAPEQVSPTEYGRTDERTDIYQLGVVFYELVTGTVPFGGEGIVEVGNAILKEQPITPSEYNSDAVAVEKIILTCLKKDPAERYQTAEEMLAALHAYLDEDDK
ncbi:MAG: protein kinase [Methanoregula sp.]|jgi:parallel beta-helix repeat protein